MRKGLRFAPETTKVIFFDLEYFVPAADRKRTPPGGLTFSPVRPGHKILGGTFLSYYPMQDKVGKRWREIVPAATIDLFLPPHAP